jgi:hypothetical protein
VPTGTLLTTVNPSAPDREFLFLFTAPRNNPSYRRGVLDAICYPAEYLIPYSYRRTHFHPQISTVPKALTGKHVIIVFVDSDRNGEVTYLPLRKATIHSVSSEQGVDACPSPKERIKLSLQLGNYIEYKDSLDQRQWHETIRTFDVLREIANGRPKYFVIVGEDRFAECRHSPSVGWEDLVNAISKSNEFPDATFMRLSHIKEYGGRSASDAPREYRGDRLFYLFRPAKIYRLDLSLFERAGSSRGPGDAATLEVRASARDSLEIDQPHQSVVSGLAERSVLITCKRSIEDAITTITIRSERKGSSEILVNSPSPTIFVKIGVSRLILIGFVLLVFLGGFAVSIDTSLVKESWIPQISNWPITFTFFAKTAGAAMLATAAFLAFRKLPSGNR